MDNWHASFNPKEFLSKVNLKDLIEPNEIFDERETVGADLSCVLCAKIKEKGILLNNKSFLCETCLAKMSMISYPQRYEKIYRKFLKAHKSWTIAYMELRDRFGFHKRESSLPIFAFLSLFFLFSNVLYIIIPLTIFLVHMYIERKKEEKLIIWNAQLSEWNELYPEPQKPKLRHFHDPKVNLTTRDNLILKIFNHWPGYPPYWRYLRQVILHRDDDHCQVSGCPSRSILHIHHKEPTSNGGEHIPNNLITLCEFHHGLEPEIGHERIWSNIKTEYFTIVREHMRQNRSSIGYHNVKPHIRRLELTTEEELKEIRNYYSLSCPLCSSNRLTIIVDDNVGVVCEDCSDSCYFSKGLTKETGPRFAELHDIEKNEGSWPMRWDMLTYKTELMASKSNPRPKNKPKSKTKKRLCPKCGSSMKLISPIAGQDWKQFWGCTNYRSTGCRGYLRVN